MEKTEEIKGGMLKNIFLALKGNNPVKKLKELFFVPSEKEINFLIYNSYIYPHHREDYIKKLKKSFWYKKKKNRKEYESFLLHFIDEEINNGLKYEFNSSNRSSRLCSAENAFELLLAPQNEKELKAYLNHLRSYGNMDFYYSWAKEAVGYIPTEKRWIKKNY